MKSSLIYSYQVENDDPQRTFSESLDQIVAAESYGFDTVLVSEHHLVENGYFPAPLVACAAIAARTTRIRIGPGVLLLPLYDPLHVAEHATVLDAISGGRLILGVGYGYRQEEFDAFGVPLEERAGRTREAVEVIGRLWTEASVDFDGTYYNYRDTKLRPPPVQKPRPPIWLASKAEGAVRAAARWADAWFADPITPFSVLKDRMRAYRETLGEVGKPTEGFEFPLMREVLCAETDEEAWDVAREAFLYLYREYLEWGHMLDEQGNPVAPGDRRALELLRNRFIVGSPETCIREAERYRDELGVTNLVMRMKAPGIPHGRVMDSIRLWGEKVLPAIG